MFFELKHKHLAFSKTAHQLNQAYKKSERALKKSACGGDERELSNVMKQHHDIEYALLFQKTPEFKQKGVKNKCLRKR